MATAIMKQKEVPEMDDVEKVISKISEESSYKRRPTQKRTWMTVPERYESILSALKNGTPIRLNIIKLPEKNCIFRKNRALAPHERSAVPLGTDHCPVG